LTKGDDPEPPVTPFPKILVESLLPEPMKVIIDSTYLGLIGVVND